MTFHQEDSKLKLLMISSQTLIGYLSRDKHHPFNSFSPFSIQFIKTREFENKEKADYFKFRSDSEIGNGLLVISTDKLSSNDQKFGMYDGCLRLKTSFKYPGITGVICHYLVYEEITETLDYTLEG